MATISFKAYTLEFGEVRDYREIRRTAIRDCDLLETRRFGIDADVATNYVYLCEKLENVFPSLRRKYYTVEWRDEEDEIITISTNEELEIAVEEMSKNNICKLYIRLRPNTYRIAMLGDQIDVEKTLNHYKSCYVCRKSIRGLRFKCMQCRDYDLCSNCMLLGNHHEHYLVRIVYPVDWSNRNGRRLAHHLRKWAKHCKDDEGKCPHKSNKRGGCPMFNSTSDDHEQKRSKEQHRDPSAEAATEATEDPQEATKHSFSQLLKIVEDNLSNISQFLDPLGINVTVMTDKDSARNKPGAKVSPQKPENHASTSEDSAKKFPGEKKKLHGKTASTSEKTAAPSTSGASSPQKESAATSAEQASEAEEWTIVQPQDESNNTSRTSSTSSLNEAIPKQVTPSAPEPEETESPKQSICSPLPQEVKDEFYHPNPKIQQAVTAMMAMGFSNEDGWLTHLLVSKDGDIGNALDYIRYANIKKG